MNLNGRIGRLERAVQERPPAPCPVCGAPVGWVPALQLVNHHGVGLGPACSRCAFPLMTNGRAVTALPPGSGMKRVILDRLPPGFGGTT